MTGIFQRLAGYLASIFYALSGPGAQRRFHIMAEAISVTDTDKVGIIFSGIDKQGIKTGAILSGLSVTVDNPVVVVSGPDATTGEYLATLTPQTTPIAGPVVANVTATDAAGATDTTTLTFNAGPAVSITAALSDVPPAA